MHTASRGVNWYDHSVNALAVSITLTLLLLLLSRFSRVRLCVAPKTAAHQALLSLGFSRQEYWSGLPFPSPIYARMLSHFSRVQLCATPWTAAHQAPLSMEFSRQEYWSGLPFPSPIHARMLSCFSPVQLCATPWTAAHQAPLSMEFSRQEYWSGFPFPSPHINTKDMDRQRPPIATSRYIFNRKVYTCLLKDSTAVVLMVP